jgi:hypothetical protein
LGILAPTNFTHPDDSIIRTIWDGAIAPKIKNDRNLQAVTINWNPKWMPNFYIGYAFASQQYKSDSALIDYKLDSKNNDMSFGSIMFRYVLPKDHVEFYGEFVFLIRAITIGNYSNFASAYGGNIINNYAQSNTYETYVFGAPSFSFTSNVVNNSFVHPSPINATPTDEAYYNYIVTIGNQPSTNSTLLACRITLPGHLRIVDHVSVFINESYFYYSQGLVANELLIFQQNNVTVPVGQYLFAVRINLVINYYRMSTSIQPITGRPGDNLIVNSTNQVVPRRQITNFKGFVSGSQVDNRDSSIDWANNYTFLPIFFTTDSRTPNNVNGLTWSYSINDVNNFSEQYSIGFINGQFFASDEAYAINPVRDSWTPGSPVEINVNYPYQDNDSFGIRVYYKIFHQGYHIVSVYQLYQPYYGLGINKANNEPKYRNANFEIYVDGNGNYLYW